MSLQTISMSQLPESVYVLSVRVDRLSQVQAIDRINQLIVNSRASNNQSPCQQVVTVNPEFVMAAQKNLLFRHCINSAALVIADGIGIVWATHYLRKPVPERVTGVDTLVALARLCADKGYHLYLLGAAPGIAEVTGQRLQKLVPDLQIAGTYAGSPALNEEEDIIERIKAAQADVLCVAYGAPAQELWIERNLSRLPVAVAIGVGGAFDFLSGRRQRAPRIMQRFALEWLYRLYREPWRWRRMLAIPRFIVSVLLKGRNTT